MARTKAPEGEPTRSELEILQVLWSNGPSTVRFVNDQLNQSKLVNYTSTLKIMQLMHEKGLLKRDDRAMTHIYSPGVKETITKKAMLQRFVKNLYNGSPSQLMVQLLGNKKTSKEELRLLKELLKKLDQ